LVLPGAYRTKWLEWWLHTMFAGRDRRARSVSSSPGDNSPNSSCRRRSPKPLEFCADFWRIPSILCLERPRPIRRFLIESRDVETLARPVDLVGRLNSLRGRIRSAGQAETASTSRSFTFLPRGGALLRPSSPWNRITFFNVRLSGPPYPLLMEGGRGVATLTRGLRRHFLGHVTLSFF